MGATAPHITGTTVLCPTKNPVDSHHKGSVVRTAFQCHDFMPHLTNVIVHFCSTRLRGRSSRVAEATASVRGSDEGRILDLPAVIERVQYERYLLQHHGGHAWWHRHGKKLIYGGTSLERPPLTAVFEERWSFMRGEQTWLVSTLSGWEGGFEIRKSAVNSSPI